MQKKEMKVKIIKNTFCNGKQMQLGKIVALKTEDAKMLIGAGKACQADKVTKKDQENIELEEIRLAKKTKNKEKLTVLKKKVK